jgi:hypothetical protein
MIGAARVLHRRDEPAAVAVPTGVAGGVPKEASADVRIGVSTLLLRDKETPPTAVADTSSSSI